MIIQSKTITPGFKHSLNRHVNITCIDLQFGAKVLARCGFTVEKQIDVYIFYNLSTNKSNSKKLKMKHGCVLEQGKVKLKGSYC